MVKSFIFPLGGLYTPKISKMLSEFILSLTAQTSTAGVHIVSSDNKSDISSQLTKIHTPPPRVDLKLWCAT